MASKDFLQGEVHALESRGLSKETCAFWGYQVGEDDKGGFHAANYRDTTGKLTHQKVRRAGKEFNVIGGGNMPLYGMWLWGKGKNIAITEGELDALSVSQVMENKWPVISLPNGAASAAKDLARHYEYLDKFDNIVLMFDQDDVGRAAAEDAAMVLPPGKVKIAVLPLKDANETLVKLGPGAVAKAFWDAKEWRPDGIVSGDTFTREMLKVKVEGIPLPYPEMQEKTMGLRKAELTLLTAGSGVGKSTWAREIAYYLRRARPTAENPNIPANGFKIGNVFLEEGNVKTGQAYVAIHNNVPLGRLRAKPDLITDAQWDDGLDKVVWHDGMEFYNHFGSLESKRLLTKLRYLAVVAKVDFIILDHISIVTSGEESSSEGERKDIDILMTRLRSLVEQTGVGIIAIVHLKRAKDKVFNEGAQVSLSDLRGSASLEQLSDNVYALERDQQAADTKKLLALIRVLKCREMGDTGEADTLIYEPKTGRLLLHATADMKL